jgi:DNA-3-methyladenine glycosylase I
MSLPYFVDGAIVIQLPGKPQSMPILIRVRVYFELSSWTTGKRDESDMKSIQIRGRIPEDLPWVIEVLTQAWGDTRVVSSGHVHRADQLPGLVALVDGEPAGLATYKMDDEACELVTLNSLRSGLGIGSMLIEAIAKHAAEAGCVRLRLITTNDNLKALAFYQKRGFRLVEVRPDAVEQARQLKPEIPASGQDGIPIMDELVLELNIYRPATLKS